MNNVDWNKVLHTLWHAALIITAAYAASTPKYGWLTVALQALAQQTPPLAFTNGPPQFLKTASMILFCLTLTGCPGIGMVGYGDLSPNQLKEIAKDKNAAVSCFRGTYAGANIDMVFINVDKGVPSNMTIDSGCKITFGSVIPTTSK